MCSIFPSYKAEKFVVTQDQKAKIKWHCRRGMLELDIILERFIARCIDNLNEQQIRDLVLLLTQADPDIYAWLMGYEEPIKELAEIVVFIQLHDHIR